MALSNPPDHAQIRGQLDRILGAESFASSPQLCRFLKYTVERTLAGEADAIKESVLGTEVCGRPNFDPRYDSVVRATATRLRGKLADYYSNGGSLDEVVIEYPRGGYVPLFRLREETAPSISTEVPAGESAVSATSAIDAPVRRWPAWWLLIPAAAGLLVAGYLVGGRFARTQSAQIPKAAARRFELALPPAMVTAMSRTPGPLAISPDGTKLALALTREGTVNTSLWIHTFENSKWIEVENSLGANNPFWSPDSAEVGYFRASSIWKVKADGTQAQAICRTTELSGQGTWPSSGTIVYAGLGHPLRKVAASGGVPEALSTLAEGELRHAWPQFLPDGDHFLYTSMGANAANSTLYISSLSNPATRQPVLKAHSRALFHDLGDGSGLIVYQGDVSMLAVRFSLSKMAVMGEPFSAGPPVAFNGQFGLSDFSIARDGTFVARYGSGAAMRRLAWMGLDGKVLARSSVEGLYRFPRLSPDGKWIATEIIDVRTGMGSLWIIDRDLETRRKLSSGKESEVGPVWSPDGKSIVFTRGTDLYRRALDGPTADVPLTNDSSMGKLATAWTPDDKVLFRATLPGPKFDVYAVAAKGGAAPVALLDGAADEMDAEVSRDGCMLTYASDEAGRLELYLTAYPLSRANRRIQLSTAGAYGGFWNRDSSQVFFVRSSNRVLVPVDARNGNPAGTERLRFELPDVTFHRGYGLDFDPVTNRILASIPSEEPAITAPVVLTNLPWTIRDSER